MDHLADHSAPESREQAESSSAARVVVFTLDQIEEMTSNFANLIGQGGFGRIYLGRSGDQDVAVKASLAGVVAARTNWEREREFLQLCDDPNVIKLLGVGEVPNPDPALECFFLVYPYYSRGALQGHISGLQWPQVIKILRGIASGVHHIHTIAAPGMVHMDLKPDNILLDMDDTPIICDFGSAVREGENMGAFTIGYQSMLVGPAYHRNDIFSLGVIILQLLTKRNSPFIGDENIAVVIGRAHRKSKEIHRSLLTSGCSKGAGKKILKLALACAAYEAASRPMVQEVVEKLNYPESSRQDRFVDRLRMGF